MILGYCLALVAAIFSSTINAALVDLDKAECISILQCEPITNFLLNTKKPLTSRTQEVLRNLRCGTTEDGKVKIYCPKKPGTNGDITKHRNIHLIPKENCGVIQLGDRIIGGNRTELFEFPWMVLLSYQIGKKRDFNCGGTLINERYVLTAAHCITDLKGKVLLGVRVGEHNLRTVDDCDDIGEICADPVQDVRVEEIIPHPKYDLISREFDIGLLRLDRNINISRDSVRAVCLPIDPKVRNISSVNGTVTGWGQVERDFHSDVLLKIQIPLVPQDQCSSIYERLKYTIKENRFCAGGADGKTDSCGGDSGGPMQVVKDVYSDVRYVQYGIVSLGPTPCATKGIPAVYTNVTFNLEWILDTIRE